MGCSRSCGSLFGMTIRSRVNSYRDLRVWQESRALALDLYTVTRGFPADERFGLTSQIRRAAVSVPCNIAEGWGLGGWRQLGRTSSIARGSLYEVDTLVDISCEVGYLTAAAVLPMNERIAEIGRMLTSMRRRAF